MSFLLSTLHHLHRFARGRARRRGVNSTQAPKLLRSSWGSARGRVIDQVSPWTLFSVILEVLNVVLVVDVPMPVVLLVRMRVWYARR